MCRGNPGKLSDPEAGSGSENSPDNASQETLIRMDDSAFAADIRHKFLRFFEVPMLCLRRRQPADAAKMHCARCIANAWRIPRADFPGSGAATGGVTAASDRVRLIDAPIHRPIPAGAIRASEQTGSVRPEYPDLTLTSGANDMTQQSLRSKTIDLRWPDLCGLEPPW